MSVKEWLFRKRFLYNPKRYWERRAEFYQSYELRLDGSGKTRTQLAALQLAIAMVNPRKVLEIGCGTGRISRVIAPSVDLFVGADIARPMISRARESVSDDAGVDWIVGSSSALPFAAEAFDCVIAIEVLLHVKPAVISQSLKDIARVSRKAIILDFFLREFEDRRSFKRVSRTLDSHNFLHRYPELFEAAGMRVLWRRELRDLSQTCFVVEVARSLAS